MASLSLIQYDAPTEPSPKRRPMAHQPAVPPIAPKSTMMSVPMPARSAAVFMLLSIGAFLGGTQHPTEPRQRRSVPPPLRLRLLVVPGMDVHAGHALA